MIFGGQLVMEGLVYLFAAVLPERNILSGIQEERVAGDPVVGRNIVSTVWFTIGGTRDLIRLFRRLDQRAEIDENDDGSVSAEEKSAE